MTTAEILKINKIRPSVIRIMVYDFLRSTNRHPTADEIYTELLPKIPTLSKTSVYNTVKLLVDSGLSKMVTIDGMQVRYDADVTVHGHFLCKNCGKVYDFKPAFNFSDELDGFDIRSKEVYYGGICRNCNKKIKNKGE